MKDYYIIVDTETTIQDHVADFGAVIVDRKGNIKHQCAILVHDIYRVEPLFYLKGETPSNLWSEQGKDRRFDHYEELLKQGKRQIASVPAINRWLTKALKEYKPILTAYNLPFDIDKCDKTGIILDGFDKRFCLWNAAYNKWGQSREYRQFVLDNHCFRAPTKLGNMSYITNAETMARFVFDNPGLEDEPHTALEDVIYYELPILKKLLKTETKKSLLEPKMKYNWNQVQVRDWFKPI